MRNGSVIRYAGKRGVVWRIRYRDADGRRVCETLKGVTEKREAEDALRERLVDVKREGRRRLEPVTFEAFAREWLDSYPDRKDLKRSTREGYEGIVNGHLAPVLGRLRLEQVDVAKLEGYVAATQRAGLAPRTVNRHLNLAHLILAAALKRQLVRVNPVSAVDRPKEPRRRWRILSPVEIGQVERAFVELDDDRAWLEQARVVFLTVVLAGLRRGEILGLRWRHVALADPAGPLLTVEETWVRGGTDTPKSDKSRRTFAIGERLGSELLDHRARTAYEGDDERVFCALETGGPLDPNRYAATFRAALKRAGVSDYLRPFHDGRHTSITNSAAAGMEPMQMMKRAGHSDFATTQLYIELAGETFPEAAELLEQRMFGHKFGQT